MVKNGFLVCLLTFLKSSVLGQYVYNIIAFFVYSTNITKNIDIKKFYGNYFAKLINKPPGNLKT